VFRRRPFPGKKLALRVAGTADRSWFFESGRRSVEELRHVVALAGKPLEEYGDALDFGCGCGRMLLWLDDLPGKGVRLHGCDIDRDAIGWVEKHLPYVDVVANDPLPPLPYPDASFDLIFNHSVFTHIDEERQDAWLTELVRVGRPGASIVLTVHGESAFAAHERQLREHGVDPAKKRNQLERDGILFLPEGRQEGFPDWYAATFHTTAYVLEHWSRWLRVRAYVFEGALGYQDTVLLERR